jgi:hypothetical protein
MGKLRHQDDIKEVLCRMEWQREKKKEKGRIRKGKRDKKIGWKTMKEKERKITEDNERETKKEREQKTVKEKQRKRTEDSGRERKKENRRQ